MMHHPVVFWAPSDLGEAASFARQALHAANRALKKDGVAYDFLPLEELPPGLNTGGIQERFGEQLDTAAVVVLALAAQFDESTRSLANYALAYWETNRRPRVMVYVAKNPSPDFDDEEAMEEMKALARFKKGVKGILGSFQDLSDFERHLSADLIEVAPSLGPRAETSTLPLRPYLAWLIRQHATLTVPGISGTDLKQLPLAKIFIRPRLRGIGSDLTNVLPGTAPLAIVGDPGSGKTTLLRYVALNLARAKAEESADDLGYKGERPTPVLINAREAVQQLGGDFPSAPSVAEWGGILGKTVSASGFRATEEDGESLLQQGGLLLMFDGLDEVAGETTRAKVAQALTALANMNPKNRVIVTCRTRAWGQDPAFGGFEEAAVQPLEESGVRTFAQRWTEAAGARAEGLEAAILENRMVRKIATNPQMLTMLAALFSAQRKLPPQRAALYKECVDWLLHSKKHGIAESGGPAAALRALTHLATKLQEARDEDGKPRQALERYEAASLLRDHLSEGTLDDAREYLRHLELYVGLVVASGSKVQFHHRTFQEYLVARNLADATDPALQLGDRVDDPQWLEVTALLAGLLADQGEQRLKKFLNDLVPKRGSIEEKAPRVGIIAQCLEDLSAWSLPEGVLAPAREALQEVLPIFEDPEQKTAERVRIAVAEGLGRTKDPRLDRQLRWVDVPEGRFWRGAAPGDKEAFVDEKPGGWVDVSAFRIQRWPVTVTEFTAFVELGGYRVRTFWSEKGWAWKTEGKVSAPEAWENQQDLGSHPVVGVSWWEAQAYGRWLSAERHLWPQDCAEVRLPTEAEWEKAARGGETLFSDGSKNLDPQRRYAWKGPFSSDRCNAEGRIGAVVSVGCFPAGHNPVGLWDMTGNVWEWCIDGWDGKSPYPSPTASNPVGVGNFRVVRGGAWSIHPRPLRVSYRSGHDPGDRSGSLGFRLVASPGRLNLAP